MKKPQSHRERRPPPIPTAASLHEAALAYVARFAATEAALRRVLTNRLRKAALQHPAFAADHATQAALKTVIESLVEKTRRIGAVDDAAYANSKAGSLRRAGRSQLFIRQKLLQKGVKPELAAAALDLSNGEIPAPEAELQAALIFAKRKRLGRFRLAKPGPRLNQDQQRKQAMKDLAVLARNGFPLAIARQALGTSDDGEVNED